MAKVLFIDLDGYLCTLISLFFSNAPPDARTERLRKHKGITKECRPFPDSGSNALLTLFLFNLSFFFLVLWLLVDL